MALIIHGDLNSHSLNHLILLTNCLARVVIVHSVFLYNKIITTGV